MIKAQSKLEITEYRPDPFRCWILDNWLAPIFARQLLETFPHATEDWYNYGNQFEVKRAQDNIDKVPHLHASVLARHNTRTFVEDLETITGITGLIPDPWFRGGGLHQIYKGGKLDIHADFNWHNHLNLDRRLNALLYLNENWIPEHGGELELWDKDMTRCVRKVEPIFNRMVIFETTGNAYHGHPNPWNHLIPRRSMAWYYYTSNSKQPVEVHSTLFKKRPDEITTPEIEALREKRNKGRIA